jgi:hypothetical protein
MKPFKTQFEDYKLSVSGLSSLAEDSFMHWFKTFVNTKSEFNPSGFLQGKVYSFEYNDQLEKNKKYINKRPIVFFTGFKSYEDRAVFYGIDLILLSPQFRIPFFTRVQSVYQDIIEKNQEKLDKGELKSQVQLKTDYETLDTILKGINYKHAYRAWDLKKVRDVVEIPYDDWTRIVYLDTRSIEGTPLNEIYKKNLQI